MTDDPEAPEDIEVVQKINPARLIQANLEALQAATRPSDAALHVANLYLTLRGIRRIDEQFQADWKKVLDGHFMHCVNHFDTRFRMEWDSIWAARDCLLDLMERHGMGFHAQLADPVQVRRTAARRRLLGELTA